VQIKNCSKVWQQRSF